MAETDGKNLPDVCSVFEGQTWRKSVCKNCFHSLKEHSQKPKIRTATMEKTATVTSSRPEVQKSAIGNNSNVTTSGTRRKAESGTDKQETRKEVSPRNGRGEVGVENNSNKKDGEGEVGIEKRSNKEIGGRKVGIIKDSYKEDVRGKVVGDKNSNKEDVRGKVCIDKHSKKEDVGGKVDIHKHSNKEDSSGKVGVDKYVNKENGREKAGVDRHSNKENSIFTLKNGTALGQKTTKSATSLQTTNEKYATCTSSVPSDTTSPTSPTKPSIKRSHYPAPATTTTTQQTPTSVSTHKTSAAATTIGVANSVDYAANSRGNSIKTQTLKAKRQISQTEAKAPVLSKEKLTRSPDEVTKNCNTVKKKSDQAKRSCGFMSTDKPTRQTALSSVDLKSHSQTSSETNLTEMASHNSNIEPDKIAREKVVGVRSEKCCSDTNIDRNLLAAASKLGKIDSSCDSNFRSHITSGQNSCKNAKNTTKQIIESNSQDRLLKSPHNTNAGIVDRLFDSPEGSANTTKEPIKNIPGPRKVPVNPVKDKIEKEKVQKSGLQDCITLKRTKAMCVSSCKETKTVSMASNMALADPNKAGHLVTDTEQRPEANSQRSSDSEDCTRSNKNSCSDTRQSGLVSIPSKAQADPAVYGKGRGKPKLSGGAGEQKQGTLNVGGGAVRPVAQSTRSQSSQPAGARLSSLPSTVTSAENTSTPVLQCHTNTEQTHTWSCLVNPTAVEQVKDQAITRQSPPLSVKPQMFSAQKTKSECEESNINNVAPQTLVGDKHAHWLTMELNANGNELDTLTEHMSQTEKHTKALADARDQLHRAASNNEQRNMDTMVSGLPEQLSNLETPCSIVEKSNQFLVQQLIVHENGMGWDQENEVGRDHDSGVGRIQESGVGRNRERRRENPENMYPIEDVGATEKQLEDLQEINKELRTQIEDMKYEMDEMYDHFRQREHQEFLDLQKELDLTAKKCRVLQLKLRKAERRNEQIEEDKIRYEEKLRMLQDLLDCGDAKNHIRALEEELRVAKEVSVRLHDELDLIEDKRNDALEDNRHLTDLLDHTDRRQFRLEMEIDKLRDIVVDLRQQLTETRHSGTDNRQLSPDKVLSSVYTKSTD